jgi:hypothetical protein
MIAVLRNDATYNQSATRGEQHFHACPVFRADTFHSLPYSFIGLLFGVDKGQTANQAKKLASRGINYDGNLGRGRSPILNPSQLIELKTSVIPADNECCPWTISKIAYSVNENMCVNVPPNTLVHVLVRDPDVKSCAGRPTDESRMNMPIKGIWFDILI